ncbi:hypothetical protein BJX99DRAFT_223505 [Aspergillus californicus]
MADSKQDANPLPPVYSSTADRPPPSTSTSTSSPGLLFQQQQQHLAIDYTQYRIAGAVLHDDRVAAVTRDERFSCDPHALLQLMHEQAQLPPKLLLRIRGSHSVYGEVKSDFDLTLNLLPLLVSDSERWSYRKLDGSRISANGDPVPTAGAVPAELEKLVVQYCEDPAPVKSFSLKRRVVNFDQGSLEGLIRNTIATTRYRGALDISFPATFAEVVVQQGSPRTSFRDLFYWSAQPPAKRDPTKRYECIEVIWPFANVPANEAGRRCAVQSEQDWWAGWRDAVRSAVLAKRHGNVTLEDRMDVAMGVAVPEPGKDWGVPK